jgi:hypothetical protein
MNIAIVIDCWKDEPKNFWQKILFLIFPTSRFVYLNINRFLNSDLIDIVIVASYDDKCTSPIILDTKKPKLFFLDIENLLDLLRNNSIDNIFMCGTAWDVCVRDRPLGYLKVNEAIQSLGLTTCILVKYNCVKTTDESYFKLKYNKDWQITNTKGIFKYNPASRSR